MKLFSVEKTKLRGMRGRDNDSGYQSELLEKEIDGEDMEMRGTGIRLLLENQRCRGGILLLKLFGRLA